MEVWVSASSVSASGTTVTFTSSLVVISPLCLSHTAHLIIGRAVLVLFIKSYFVFVFCL